MPTVPTLTTLHRAEFPGDHYATVMVLIDNAGGAPRHTHPGLEMTYILEGDVHIDGGRTSRSSLEARRLVRGSC